MALTYAQLLDLAVEQALAGAPEQAEGDIEVRAEALASTAMRSLAMGVAADPEKRHTLIRNVTIALTNGAGVIPDTVLLDYLCSATLSNPNDATEDYAYVPFWDDYRETSDRRLGYFTNQGTTLDVTQPTVAYTAGSGLTGNVDLTTPTAPVPPAAATDPIANLPVDLEPDLISSLARMLRGGK